MNITEANAVNAVLGYFLGISDDAEKARGEAEFLADRAHMSLHAGITGDDVDEVWELLELPGWPEEPDRLVDDVVSPLLVDPDGPQNPGMYRNQAPDSRHRRVGTAVDERRNP